MDLQELTGFLGYDIEDESFENYLKENALLKELEEKEGCTIYVTYPEKGIALCYEYMNCNQNDALIFASLFVYQKDETYGSYQGEMMDDVEFNTERDELIENFGEPVFSYKEKKGNVLSEIFSTEEKYMINVTYQNRRFEGINLIQFDLKTILEEEEEAEADGQSLSLKESMIQRAKTLTKRRLSPKEVDAIEQKILAIAVPSE